MKRNRKGNKCQWCAREARVCWVMPCLELQTVIDSRDTDLLRQWANAANALLIEHDGSESR